MQQRSSLHHDIGFITITLEALHIEEELGSICRLLPSLVIGGGVSLAVLLELLTRTELKTGHEFLSMMWNSVEVFEETCLQIGTIATTILNSSLLV